ncbi:GntR family transcriptional regulator [Rhodopseudomonas palustris]|uniref:GntR family transcriptional regulator n=1 Tax=Rhodopseudomonas palustris TaxID=1076 RepID=UPI0002F6D939|nr:GntR family transcriptional regulator [Rhodopseudomonas palustris]
MTDATAETEDIRRRLNETQQPLYVSLSNLLETDIYEGRWPAGAQLPTIAELSERYDVARVTIRQALGVLSAKGLIIPIQGKGTFVADQVKPRKTISLDSDWNYLLATLDGNSAESLDVIKSCALPSTVDGPEKHFKDYRYMKRIHRAYDEPYCVNDVYLANDYYNRDPETFDRQMIIPHLTRVSRAKLKRMKQSVRITSADLAVAKYMNIPVNAPVAEVRRLITNRKDEIVFFSTGLYRGDLVVFNTTIDVPG